MFQAQLPVIICLSSSDCYLNQLYVKKRIPYSSKNDFKKWLSNLLFTKFYTYFSWMKIKCIINFTVRMNDKIKWILKNSFNVRLSSAKHILGTLTV